MSEANNTIHVHRLDGCRPTPLAHYLKALGILRLVADQADENVRGWWKDDVFHIATTLDKESLESFFLNDYCPTPIISPWLKGSGFYQSNDPGLDPIEKSTCDRLCSFREGVAFVRAQLSAIELADAAVRSIKARTKPTSAFQTQQQRDLLIESEAFKQCHHGMEKEVGECRDLIQKASDSDVPEKQRPSEKQLKDAEKRIYEMPSMKEGVNFLISDPGKDTMDSTQDRRPSKNEVKKLKDSAGYKRLLRVADSVFAKLKAGLILECKTHWRGQIADWLAVAMVIGSDESVEWPRLLGTGGNDGNLDFTNNSMEQIGILFCLKTGNSTDVAKPLLRSSLFAEMNHSLSGAKLGQYFPSAEKANAWDYVLMMEGLLEFRAGVARKCAASELPQASAPFAVILSSAGLASSAPEDASGRGEQWVPIWNRPSTLSEVDLMFAEGRAVAGRDAPRRGTDLARSFARMGAARGIAGFERFGILKRNGDSHYTTPLGRFACSHSSNQQLLDEVADWIDHLRRVANAPNAPKTFERAHRACEEALMNCTQKPAGASFLSLLVSLGQAEDQMLKSPKHSKDNDAKPIPRLSRKWADVILSSELERLPEVRLAFALAAQTGPLETNKRWQTVRNHWLPLDATRFATGEDGNRFASGENGLAIGPEQSAIGLDLERAMIAMFDRRLLAMSRGAAKGFVPLAISDWRYGAKPEDIETFLEQRVDDAKILSIARGLMAIDLTRDKSKSAKPPRHDSVNDKRPLGGLATYGLLRLAMPTKGKSKGESKAKSVSLGKGQDYEIRCNSTIFRRLQSGDLGKAIELAARQLSHAGLRPRFATAVGSQQTARRLAASMAFGVAPPTLTRFAFGLTAPEMDVKDKREFAAECST